MCRYVGCPSLYIFGCHIGVYMLGVSSGVDMLSLPCVPAKGRRKSAVLVGRGSSGCVLHYPCLHRGSSSIMLQSALCFTGQSACHCTMFQAVTALLGKARVTASLGRARDLNVLCGVRCGRDDAPRAPSILHMSKRRLPTCRIAVCNF